MAFTGNYMCTSFKKELMYGAHDFDASSGDTFKIALYTSSATMTAATTAYATTNEVSGTGYTSGGEALTPVDPTSSGTTALTDFADETWGSSTITARGALIYNSTPNTTSISLTNPAILVLDFGADKAVSSGNFTVVFPTADASTAIIRIA
jgi:hypothetical protein|tara:strand:- start:1215 stop:1667 length:453 start_codon:yes stop_codon:yes gene_type:complete